MLSKIYIDPILLATSDSNYGLVAHTAIIFIQSKSTNHPDEHISYSVVCTSKLAIMKLSSLNDMLYFCQQKPPSIYEPPPSIFSNVDHQLSLFSD